MNSHEVAEQLVRARLRAEALQEYPADIPGTLEAAYAIQDEAIGMWPDRLVGWKVGRIDHPWSDHLGEDRLIGPIFARDVRHAAPAKVIEFPVFEGGFAAIEAEFVFRLTSEARRHLTPWTVNEAAQLDCALHVGIETAGSPLATINALGPLAVISDFGNNAGLLLGPEISNWRERRFESLACETFIDEQAVGRGDAASVPGGPLAALTFALQRCARRGRSLDAGDLISTGATTGIHVLRSGQHARVRFNGIAELRCHAVPASRREEFT